MKKDGKSESQVGSSHRGGQGIDKFTQGFVRKKARQLAGKFGFKRHDRDEIAQQLYLKLVKHLDAADPDDPKWKAFVAITVYRCIANLIRDNKAEKRDYRRACSIHVVIGADGDGPVELADTISEHEIPAHRARAKRSERDLADLQIDMAACIADLPDENHREFCERLKHDSISQIARDTGIPRTTLSAWLVRLRRRFEEHGLRDYL
jgi:RNA polymerase sigma factor (sigma-70 family)